MYNLQKFKKFQIMILKYLPILFCNIPHMVHGLEILYHGNLVQAVVTEICIASPPIEHLGSSKFLLHTEEPYSQFFENVHVVDNVDGFA